MKRHGKLFPKIVSYENLLLAYQRARRGKTWQYAVRRMEADLKHSLVVLRDSLIHRTYTTSRYTEKRIFEPKERTIYRLPFYPDRIVQHALMNVVEPIWDALFIHDSYACRMGKGLHAGSRKTMEFVRCHRYCLKCDISKFYPSVDHEILYYIVNRKIKCRDTLWLIKNIICSVDGGKNVPIGNYTSQWFGNLYLNELDHFIKSHFKISAYIRYCDDFCLFHNDKQALASAADAVRGFCADRLKLSLSKCDLFPVSRGVDFLGYRHFPRYILIRKSTVKRVKRRIAALPAAFLSGAITPDEFRSSLASTIGWLKWANSYHLRQGLNIDALWDMARNAA